MIHGSVGDPFPNPHDGGATSLQTVTVEIDLLTTSAFDSLTELMKAARDIGERPAAERSL